MTLDGVLSELTAALQEAGGVEFVVAGFGQDRWPLDVALDLLESLTQIEEVITSLERGEPAVLGFWEQGRAREIELVPEGSMVHAHCRSFEDGWTPNPPSCELDRGSLVSQFRQLVRTFIRVSGGSPAVRSELAAWAARIGA